MAKPTNIVQESSQQAAIGRVADDYLKNKSMQFSHQELNQWTATLASISSHPEDFISWIENDLRRFYPFKGLVLAHGELTAGELRVTHLIAVGHNQDYLSQLAKTFDLERRGALKQWFIDRRPIFIAIDAPHPAASKFELEEMKEAGFSTVAGHGVLNVRSNAGTYFGFANVKVASAQWHSNALELIAPYLNSRFLRHISEIDQRENGIFDKITPRQREIVRLLAAGHNDKLIARHLGVSEKTIRNQLTMIYSELGVHKRTELMALLK
jgi:DNA-binding CsgD family transcriptional regulator